MDVDAAPYARFGNLLNEYLRDRERSASWLAQRLRVRASTVTRWLAGETRPKTPERVLDILDALAVFSREARTGMLAAAGYAVAPDSPAQGATDDAPPEPKEPASHRSFIQHQGESVRFMWNDAVDLIDWSELPEHARSWEGRLLFGLGKLGRATGPDGFLRIILGVALWAATVAAVGPIMAWPLADPALRLAACVKFVIGLYMLPVLVALLTRPEGHELICRDDCPRGKVLLLKLAGAATGFFAFSGVAVFVSLAVYYLTAQTPPSWFIALLCVMPLLFAFAGARRIPLDRYHMFKGTIKLHPADGWTMVAALVFAPALAYWVYAYQWVLADRLLGAMLLLGALMAVAWGERRRALQAV